MRKAQYTVRLDPVRVERPEQAQRAHVRLRVEDVVNHALEVVRAVGVVHEVLRVGALKLELMR